MFKFCIFVKPYELTFLSGGKSVDLSSLNW